MKLPDSLLAALEIGLNRYLALDPAALEQCANLQGRVIAFHLREFDSTAFLLPGRTGVQVLGQWDATPDVCLSGSLPAFSRMLMPNVEQAEILLSGAIEIQGDSELAQDFSALLRRVHFDPEELLAGHLGSVAAHAIGNFARNAFGFGQRTAKTLGRDTAEYLREETRDLVHRADVQKWMAEVDGLRDDVERLEARLKRLAQQRGKGRSGLMSRFAQMRRLWQIQKVARKYGLGELLGESGRRFGFGPSPAMQALPLGVRIREALEELGPVFVKFGQTLSTRRDLLPPDIADELVKLQDQVPPFPGEQAMAMVEAAYGFPLTQIFEYFEVTPLASASIAQVHAARLKPQAGQPDGIDVVVKVLRPGVQEQIRRDVDLMRTLAALVERYWSEGKRLRPIEVVQEYEKVIFDELDLLREAANASQLRRNWLGSELIYHPSVFFDWTRTNVMVMERIHGIGIDDLEALRAQKVNFKVLAERGVQIFFNEVFRDNFFHADMHPGNIFVDVDNPEKPRYIALDFGIVGSLSPPDQRYLAENFLAFFNHDYRRVAELHVESEWVPLGTRVDEFESAIRSVCEPIFNRPLKDISFGMFLVRLFQVARRFNMVVQPQLVLLEKTLLSIEGLGRQLYPDLDLWKTAKPIMEEWMRNRIGPRATLDRFRDQIPALAETLPHLAHTVLRRLETGSATPGVEQARALAEFREEISRGNRRNLQVIAGAALVIVACLLPGIAQGVMTHWAGLPAVTWVLGGAGLYMWYRAFRS